MAIAKIKKVEIVGLQKDRDSLLSLLQKLEIIELISVSGPSSSTEERNESVELNLSEIEEAISFLGAWREKVGLLEGMVKLRPLVYRQQLEEIIQEFDYQGLLKELSDARNQLKGLLQHKERLNQEMRLLEPWQKLDIPLDQIHPTDHCGILFGVLNRGDYLNLAKDLDKEGLRVFFEIVHQDKTNAYLVILYLKEEFEKLEAILKRSRFNAVVFARHKGTVKERVSQINRETLVLDGQMQGVKDKIAQLSHQQFKLMVVYDYLSNIRNRQAIDETLIKQKFTFIMSGWVRLKDVQLLQQALPERFKEIAIFISESQAHEDIPIALENRNIIQPFEAVTNLYGQPTYRGVDPTCYLAPFFTFSFGFCLLDAGYGLILLMITLFFLKKREISPAGRHFLKLFLFMSIGTVCAGLITGSFFGDLISRLPGQFAFLKNFQRRMIWFDPVKDSLVFLGITLIFGFVQIWLGVLIKLIQDLKRDKFTAFVLDFPTLSVQTSLLILALVFAKVLPLFILNYALALFILSALSIIYYNWRINSEISLKLFWSIFGIYSVVTGNFIADTLSFSRIFALGLTGGLLATAINTMLLPAAFPRGLYAWIGGVLAILVLLIAHIINLAIGVLGAYVHTSRLQYLEFFTKFFELGGRRFRPFREETKYIFLAENNS